MISLRLDKDGSNHYILRSKDHRNYGEFFTGVMEQGLQGTLFYFHTGGSKGNRRKQHSVFIKGLTEKELIKDWESIRNKYL